jgi:septal ring factor EnvC (AmiA/AmiB activator)
MRTAPPRRAARLAALAVAGGCLFAPALGVAQTGPSLDEIERQREESEAQGRELTREAARLAEEEAEISRRLVAVAEEARGYERGIREVREHLAGLRAEETRKSAELHSGRAKLTRLLAALERLARHPPEALIASSRSPRDTLRSAMLLRAAIPRLEAEARDLKAALAALASLRDRAAAREADLSRAGDALHARRRELAGLLDRKRELGRATRAEREEASARVAALAVQARTLRELVAELERERERRHRAEQARLRREADLARKLREAERIQLRPPPPPRASLALGPLPSISAAHGRLAMPVTGNVVERFGAPGAAGGTAKGVRIETEEGAQVVVPFDGTVAFAGPFRGYGRLLIIDHGEGYHSLLAGLGRIDVGVGQRLLAGEPVGVAAPAEKGPPRLYIELRRDGRPIDPLPWLAAPPKSKVSG